jgi:predicted nuclease of predicted toxin-antitoxin system
MQQSELGKRQWVSSDSWRLLLDENLPKTLWKALQAAGYPTTRLVDEGLRGQPDSVIFRQVRSRATIITRDKDFLKTDQFPIPHSGIIVVRLPNSTSAAEVVREVLNALTTLTEQDLTNKVFVVEPGQVRLRS